MQTATVRKLPKSLIPEWVKNDPFWSSALYILQTAARREPKFMQLKHLVNFEHALIEFDAMKQAAASWSRGEKLLVDLAAHLFNERHPFNLSELDYLDSFNRKTALEAIRLRFRV